MTHGADPNAKNASGESPRQLAERRNFPHLLRLMEVPVTAQKFNNLGQGNSGAQVGECVIKKIISGGQTGADSAALDFAIWHEIPHGGWCPKGRLCENGTIDPRYQLTQTSTKNYPRRTEKNVLDSDSFAACEGETGIGAISPIPFPVFAAPKRIKLRYT
jgi:Circularly permutated YpsA SLOG family